MCGSTRRPPTLSYARTRCKRLGVQLRAGRGCDHQDLQADRPGLPQQPSLVEQSVGFWSPCNQWLCVVVHHHRHRADAVLLEQAECFRGLVHALALLDQRGGHVLDAKPERADAGVPREGQMLFQLQGVVDGDLGAPTDSLADWGAVDFGVGQCFQDLQRALFVVEEVIVRAEEIAQAVFASKPGHLCGDALSALDAVLPLVICRNRTVWAVEFAPQRQDQRDDRRVSTNLTRAPQAAARPT